MRQWKAPHRCAERKSRASGPGKIRRGPELYELRRMWRINVGQLGRTNREKRRPRAVPTGRQVAVPLAAAACISLDMTVLAGHRWGANLEVRME